MRSDGFLSHRIVDAIIANLCDRRGLRGKWEEIDKDIQQEIRSTWIGLVQIELGTISDMEDPDYGKDWRHLQIILREEEVERIARKIVEFQDERTKTILAQWNQYP